MCAAALRHIFLFSLISVLFSHLQEALAETKANEKALQRHKVQDIGRAYLNFLIEEEQYEKAAR